MMFGRGYGGCFGYGGYGIWNYLIMGGILLVVIALVIWSRNKSQNSSNTQVMALLKEKYVLGEITEEEYIKRKNVLDRE